MYLQSLFFLIPFLLVTGLPSQAEFCEPKPRVLLLGDSWAHVMWLAKSLRTAFDEAGLGDVVEKGEITAIGGTRADQWKKADKLALVSQELIEFQTLDTVHISLGGNDFFSKWKTSQADSEQEQVFTTIAADLKVLIDHILHERSNLRVFLCGYTWLNFEETRAAGVVPWCVSSGEGSIWARMGSPTPRILNQALARLEFHKALLADPDARVFHLDNLGLMQYHFGYPSRGIPPKSVPLPEGDPSLPSPPEAMNNALDCAHLSEEGYLVLARNCVTRFYEQQYRPRGDSLRLFPATCQGQPLDSARLLLGDTEKDEVTTLGLTFETSSLPKDATLTGARLFLTRKHLSGANPFDRNSTPLGQPLCHIRTVDCLHDHPDISPPAGPPRVQDVGTFVGSAGEDRWRVRIDLKPEAVSCLHEGAATTIQLEFEKASPNATSDAIEFFPADAEQESDRPLLEVFWNPEENSSGEDESIKDQRGG